MASFWSKCRLILRPPPGKPRNNGPMERWRVEDLMELADAAYAAGLSSFIVRRTLQRMERGEISVCDAVSNITRRRRKCTAPTPENRSSAS